MVIFPLDIHDHFGCFRELSCPIQGVILTHTNTCYYSILFHTYAHPERTSARTMPGQRPRRCASIVLVLVQHGTCYWLFVIVSGLWISRHLHRKQNICMTFVQRQPNVFDVGSTLYKCYTNVLCLLGICAEQHGWLQHGWLQNVGPC